MPTGQVPRVARLLAVAHRCQQLVQAGVIANYATLAQLGHLSRARVTQILNLLLLAPDIQEMLLFLTADRAGRDPIVEIDHVANDLREVQRLRRARRIALALDVHRRQVQ